MQPAFEKQWEQSFSHLVDYKKTFGDVNVPRRYISPDGFNLGTWVHRQRISYKKGIISNKRYQELQSIGFCFNGNSKIIDTNNYKWETGYLHLHEYKAKYGHVIVPRDYIANDNFKLGSWLNWQKRRFRTGKIDTDQAKRLLDLGVDFQSRTRAVLLSEWEKGFSHLKDFYNMYGNANAKLDYISPDGFKLGHWLHLQRIASKYNRLSVEQLDKLLRIHCFLYVADHTLYNDLWEKGYSHLFGYVQQYGNSKVMNNYVCSDGYRLGRWVAWQREHYVKLSIKQIMELEKVSFVWKIQSKKKKKDLFQEL